METPPFEKPEADPDAGWVGGWSTGARANSAALLRWMLWGLVALGPLLGALAYLSVPNSPVTAAPKSAPSVPVASGGQGAAGFASLFIGAYLPVGSGDEPKLAVHYPPAGSLQLDGGSGRCRGEQLTLVRLRQIGSTVWSVTVAARVTGASPTASKYCEPGDR
ncbi:hypothetical protein [Streptomyces sp. NPDC047981]|uniref:hypothetical protein n=1 Tax=Streptomyces sp. NPDC047981 TaxID=3154610 RepID=UPI003415A6FC